MAVEKFPVKPVERPHTEITTDTSAITGSSSGSDKLVMLIGSATGGKPGTVYKVRNYIQAKQIFRSGELLDALELAWNPSGQSTGAGDVLAIRVEDATNATLLQGSTTFSSKLYGGDANAIQVKFATESVSSLVSRNLTVSFAPDNYERVYRNIGTIFTITYTGTKTYGGVDVADGVLNLYEGDAEAGATKTVSFSLGDGKYSKANALVNAINNVSGFTATVPAGYDKNIDTVGLDSLAKVSIKATKVSVTGLIADLKRQLEFDEYIAVTTTGISTLADFALTNLTGGDNGTVGESWYDKISLFSHEGGYYLVPLTDKPAVHAEALSFVKERTTNGEPMRAILGAGIDETPEQLLTRSANLRDGRAMLVGFSATKELGDGRITKIPAYMSASQVAGLASGIDIGESITFKQLSISALSTVYDGAQLDTLNTGGVVMAEFVRNRNTTKFRIVDDITTYNDGSDPVRNQMAVGEANDFLVSELKILLDESYIGTRVIDISASLIKNSVQSFLDQKKRDNEIQDYNAEEVQVVIDGEVVNISMVVYPIRSVKKIAVSLVYKQQVLTS